GSRPLRRYVPPQAVVGVVPYLGAASGVDTGPAFRHIEVLRGALTTLSVHLLINREGLLAVDGVSRGFGQSRLTGWRFDGGPSDGLSESVQSSVEHCRATLLLRHVRVDSAGRTP